jgi:pyruvate,orthophosphate dikinase
MTWADKFRKLQVRTNADTPADARKARELGAEGIGLCRTEHMFFEEDRIAAFREMICSDTVEEREAALAKIEPMQQGDFEKLYEAMEGYGVTIRYLDPPLHEFVPTDEKDIELLANSQGKTVEQIKNIIASLHEFNPMMGHRGCRLAVTYPEIAAMQTRAVIKAAIAVSQRKNIKIVPEIMIPLVGEIKELKYVKNVVCETADKVIADAGVELEYHVGTMIEIPRAALTADEIAKEAEFFSFGTNDLTQMTFGYSRDDAEGKFLNRYVEQKILATNPFETLDTKGVGALLEMSMEKGHKVNPALVGGVCGEHGGDPDSVIFCHKIGLNYVSCSPFRIPQAKLAAAQAVIENK